MLETFLECNGVFKSLDNNMCALVGREIF